MSTHHASTAHVSIDASDLSAALAEPSTRSIAARSCSSRDRRPRCSGRWSRPSGPGATSQAQGREVRFGTRPDGRVSVELTDIASGRALDEIGPIGLFRLLNLASLTTRAGSVRAQAREPALRADIGGEGAAGVRLGSAQVPRRRAAVVSTPPPVELGITM